MYKKLTDSGWINYARMCPKCKSYIPKHRRKCHKCGCLVRNDHGRVYAR